MWVVSAVLLQTHPGLDTQLDWIMRAQVVMAVGIALLVILAVVVGIALIVLIRALTRLIQSLETQVSTLGPRARPILARATKVADDATQISDMVRQDLSRLHKRVGEMDERFESVTAEVEARTRRFGVVMRVIQDELEDILLDTTATVRGMHATAEALGTPTDPDTGPSGTMKERTDRTGSARTEQESESPPATSDEPGA